MKWFANLEEDDNNEDENSGQEIGAVWQVLAVEGFSESSDFILASD